MFNTLRRVVGNGRFPAAVFGGVAAGSALAAGGTVYASDAGLHPPHNEWPHDGWLSSFDTASLRRGYEVYRQVCSSCHSMQYLCFRNLVGVTHTEAQAKALAQSYTVIDEQPDDEGKPLERPGKLSDRFPSPYPNEQYARYINAGAYPPDLSLMIKARHGREDYVFALLTGYREPPAGVTLRQGLHYNPYFPGGAISMAKALMDEGLEYEDGTEATICQQAKDVTCFLTWAAEPEHDERKKTGAKWLLAIGMCAALSGWYKRFKWNVLKSKRISYTY